MLRFAFFLFLSMACVLAQPTPIITTIAGTGTPGFSGDGGPAVRARFNFLIGDDEFEEYSHPAVDADGNIYIADQGNDRIRKIAPDGSISTVAGNGQSGFGGDGGPAAQAMLFSPISVAFDPAGNLYIVDQDNHRVRRVDKDGVITTVAGKGEGFDRGNGGLATQAVLNAPGGIAFDAAGNMYISDTYSSQIRKVAVATGIITAFAGTTDEDFTGDGAAANLAGIAFPAGLAFDKAGNLYFCDQHNNRVRRVGTDGIITTVAGNGTPTFNGDGGPATRASLDYPADLAFDKDGNLFIADQDNHRIRKITPAGIITTVAGNGAAGFSGDGGNPLSASLSHPGGIAFDKDGNLIVVDQYNYRVRKIVFNPPALSSSTATLAFAATAGGNAPAPQTFTLSNSGSGSLSYTITSTQPWLDASPASGTLQSGTPATITVRANITNLMAGDYTGIVRVQSAGAANSPLEVQVSLTVRPLATPSPTFTSAGVVSAASFASGGIAPGEIVAIFGSNLGPATGLLAALDPATGRLATTLGGVTVTFNDVPAPLFFARQDQLNVQAPYELAAQTSARIVVRYLAASSTPVTAPMAASAPGIFATDRGAGQAALLNQDFSVNSAANPAVRGSVVQIFLTGQGATNPPAVTGQLSQAPFPAPALSVAVRIGGRTAQTSFIGLAPGLAGLLQINAVVPEDTTPGNNVALEVTIGAATSQPGVTIAVK